MLILLAMAVTTGLLGVLTTVSALIVAAILAGNGPWGVYPPAGHSGH